MHNAGGATPVLRQGHACDVPLDQVTFSARFPDHEHRRVVQIWDSLAYGMELHLY